MSYKKLPYTWGSKTNAWITAKTTGNAEGDTVWNTDWNIMEIWTGTGWTHDQAVLRYSGGQDALAVGNLVRTNNDSSIRLASTAEDSYTGCIIRGSVADSVVGGGPVLVAYQGAWDVKYNAATTRGYMAELSSPAGTASAVNVGDGDIIGQCLETIASAGLAKTVLQTVEFG